LPPFTLEYTSSLPGKRQRKMNETSIQRTLLYIVKLLNHFIGVNYLDIQKISNLKVSIQHSVKVKGIEFIG